MATISRVQVTTYLSTDEQLGDWELVKSHLDDGGKDAHVLRELIRNKATDIRHGSTRRQAIERIENDIGDLKSEQLRHSDMLEHIMREIENG